MVVVVVVVVVVGVVVPKVLFQSLPFKESQCHHIAPVHCFHRSDLCSRSLSWESRTERLPKM